MSPQILIGASSSSKLCCWTKSLWKKHKEAWSRSRKAVHLFTCPCGHEMKKRMGDREWKENKKVWERRMKKKIEKKILKEFQNKNKQKNEKKIIIK